MLKNTYLLLSGTLLFSAGCAWFALISNAQPLGFVTTLIGIFGLSYLTQSLRNSAMGLLAIFAFTGFLGYTLGPMFNMILANYTNGADIIFTALGATGIIFLSLSAYVLTTRKNFRTTECATKMSKKASETATSDMCPYFQETFGCYPACYCNDATYKSLIDESIKTSEDGLKAMGIKDCSLTCLKQVFN